MRRRTLLASLGVAAAGGAVGTGAFTSVEASRTVNVSIADEDTALLALTELDEGMVNQQTRNRIELNIDDGLNTGDGGDGVGSRSEYVFDEVFGITNQGTQTVYVQSEFSEDGGRSGVLPGFYVETSDDKLLGEDAALVIEPGQTGAVGAHIDVDDVDVGFEENGTNLEQFNFDATISAEAEKPSGLTLLNNDGEEYDGGDDGDSGPDV